jgi:hypothetical protein
MFRSVAFSLACLILFSPAVLSQDIGIDELVAKHQASIGTPEQLAAASSRLAMGLSTFEAKLPAKTTGGKAVIASDSRNLMYITSFASREYDFEKIGFFDDKVNLPWVRPGARSPLGAFVADHEKMLSERVFAGSMSANWVMLDKDLGKRIKLSGTKKINGKKAYVVDYFPKNSGTEFTVQMFFDADTFQHIRTEYRHVINPRQDTFGTLGRQAGVRQVLTEDFSDFKKVDSLTFPHAYKISYLTESNSGVFEYFWGIKITEYRLNQSFGPGFFTFETKSE